MATVITAEEARLRRRHHPLPNGTDTWLSTYLGMNAAEARALGGDPVSSEVRSGRLYPVAYLVEQAPGTTIRGHFHRADQFQLFLGAGGTFGNRRLPRAAIHYAAAFTPYAPISAGETVLEYMTLRNGWDPGARWMPESRGELPGPPRRGDAALAVIADGSGDLADEHQAVLRTDSSGAADTRILLESGKGLGAWLHRLRPGAELLCPAPDGGGGQFFFVLAGRCLSGSASLPARALCFVAPDEPAITLRGGENGATVIALQFARKDGMDGRPTAHAEGS